MTTTIDPAASPAIPARRTSRPDGEVDLERDAELVRRAQAGDRAAFAELYEWYHDRLLRVCTRRLKDQDLAEEVVQEAFARAWRALPGFGGERRFYPWLSVIAAHLCIDEEARRRRVAPVAELAVSRLVSDEETGEDRVLALSDQQTVAQAFGRLSGRHRRLLVAREQLGWSYQEIAAAEGVPISTVETALFRARRALKKLVLAAEGRVEGSALVVLGGLLGLRRRLQGIGQALAPPSASGAPALARGTVALALLGAGVATGVAIGPMTPAPAPRPAVAGSAPAPPGQLPAARLGPAPRLEPLPATGLPGSAASPPSGPGSSGAHSTPGAASADPGIPGASAQGTQQLLPDVSGGAPAATVLLPNVLGPGTALVGTPSFATQSAPLPSSGPGSSVPQGSTPLTRALTDLGQDGTSLASGTARAVVQSVTGVLGGS